MKNALRTKQWFNRHLACELAALSIALVAMVKHANLEHIQAVRFGSRIDATSVCVTIAIIIGLIGLLLPAKPGQSKRLAFAVFLLMFLTFFLIPAFLPAK
jgi:hypothetical protein